MRVTVVLGMVLGCIASSTVHLQAGWLGDCAGMPSGGTEVCDSGCALGPWSNGCDCANCLAGCGVVDPYCRLLPSDGRLKIYGWLNGGFIGNTSSPNSKFNGPYNAVDRSNEPMFNQGYLVGEVGLPLDGSWGLGGRIDALYGEDFLLAQSLGLELRPDGSPRWNSHEYYGLAMPQAYVEVGRTDLSLKIGHFYTPIGYEGVPAPANFFYSKSYSYMFAGPFTHWGGLMTWKMASGWQTQLGLHNGWNAIDRVVDNMGVLAGIRYTEPCERWWSSFAITTGDDFNDLAALPGVVPDFTNRTRYSWLVFMKLTERLDYVFHQWLGFQEDGARPVNARTGTDWITTRTTRSTNAGKPVSVTNGSATRKARASA